MRFPLTGYVDLAIYIFGKLVPSFVKVGKESLSSTNTRLKFILFMNRIVNMLDTFT